MKKMMMALAAVALASAVQAAATFNFTGFDAKYNGYNFYVVSSTPIRDSGTDEQAKKMLNNVFLSESTRNDMGFSTWQSYYAMANDNIPLSTIGADGSASWQVEQYDAGSTYWGVSVLAFNGGVAPGNEYVLFDMVEYSDPSATLSPAFNMSSANVQTGHLLTDGAVPEPTSGLLMLVGLAGLALKRKRA